ncbi:FKBP-type peptidyl-prolyl cis-trans isomerase [Brachybacterium sacelli]|uniref:Peptidyl-prolyl cis-trans isomerase n=1 Tax=Brachybacterium sacelli TaxID=173364 RepID=A0ABS4X746_9MICO|nr:FKBP-type peptidyl-prolyl cis-trans isomerase [Brachybacterium sacelli]MBP2384300.1 peptidylprolyl isomerase [Brachybacterium sacelli]
MIRRRTLLTTALAATAAIGLAACSEDGSDPEATGAASDAGGGEPALSGVTVGEDLGAEPTVEFSAPLAISGPDAQVIVPGDGAKIAEGDNLIWRSLYADAATGETLQSWWQGAPASGLRVDAEGVGQSALEALTTATVGSRVAMAGWQTSQSGDNYSLVQVADIDRVVDPLRAEGESGDPSGDFPAVTLDDKGAPALQDTPQGDPPTETVREELIVGTGERTREGDYLVMHYTGWSWADGKQFDSSWERDAPFSFVQGAGRVIPGWDQGLLDLPVGSQVMLVLPPAAAYGEKGENDEELNGQTLIFVIDVLDAAHRAD